MALRINWEKKSLIEKKQNQLSAYYIQVYNNNIIDEFIEDYLKDVKDAKPTSEMLFADLWALNKPHVYKQYNRIINSPYTSNEAFFKQLMRNKADNRVNDVVEAEIDRISRNLDYIEQVIGKYELNLKEYGKIARKEGATANRKDIFSRSVSDIDYVRSNFGININSNVFTYRDIEVTAEALNRQTQMIASYDEYDAINDESRNKGKDEPYTKKKWIWTGRGKTTRHRSNNGQVVDFKDTFTIVNDSTGAVDELMYPCDPHGSLGNTWICYCQIEAF